MIDTGSGGGSSGGGGSLFCEITYAFYNPLQCNGGGGSGNCVDVGFGFTTIYTPDRNVFCNFPVPPTLSPQQTLPTCSITLQYRAVMGDPFILVGSVGTAAHMYLYVTTPYGSYFVEGVNLNGTLIAQETDNGLPNNHPRADHIAGDVSGSFVCDWLSRIDGAAARVNAAQVSYNPLGPTLTLGNAANSSTALFYILTQLPSVAPGQNRPWWGDPGIVGFVYYPF